MTKRDAELLQRRSGETHPAFPSPKDRVVDCTVPVDVDALAVIRSSGVAIRIVDGGKATTKVADRALGSSLHGRTENRLGGAVLR